jgi:transposase-like protein
VFRGSGEEITTKRTRRNHTPVFKVKAVLAAIKGEKTLTELAQQLDMHTNQIATWKTQLLGSVDSYQSHRTMAASLMIAR